MKKFKEYFNMNEKIDTSPNYLIGKKIKVRDDAYVSVKGKVGIIYAVSDTSNSVFAKFGNDKVQVFPRDYELIK